MIQRLRVEAARRGAEAGLCQFRYYVTLESFIETSPRLYLYHVNRRGEGRWTSNVRERIPVTQQGWLFADRWSARWRPNWRTRSARDPLFCRGKSIVPYYRKMSRHVLVKSSMLIFYIKCIYRVKKKRVSIHWSLSFSFSFSHTHFFSPFSLIFLRFFPPFSSLCRYAWMRGISEEVAIEIFKLFSLPARFPVDRGSSQFHCLDHRRRKAFGYRELST